MENKLQRTTVTPKDLTLQLLEKITNNFSEEHKVGSGGYGKVYKGVLDDGEEIAVKKLHPMPGLDDKQFKKEFNNLMRVQHRNIVRLVGYCYEIRHRHFEHNGEFVFARVEDRALCFEYLQGGSLENHLDDESCGLDWHICYKIIKGVCEGLNYLHNGSEIPITHMDLKPGNILLDKNMMPKIADFGLSRLFASTQTYTTKKNYRNTWVHATRIHRQTPNFTEVRHLQFGCYNHTDNDRTSRPLKRDEMSSQQFIELVHENWKNRLQETMSSHTSLEVKTCIEIALRCVEAERKKRPAITEIVDELNKIDTAKMSLIDQSSGSKECLRIDPLEVRFPFELSKEISCVLQLTNKTDDCIAFTIKMNQGKYYAQPDKGIMPPWSKRYIIVTMRAQENAPLNMQCNDMFLVQSRKVSEDLAVDNATERLKETMGKPVNEESKLPIVYVGLAQTSTPITLRV